ncbi:hypothetical protein IIA95_01920 [Patescibacteria group bacterium]|nr:hypothetical protein [Patescibacteria group bacterium]
MKQSQFFIKTLREFPKDEESANARLLLRGGFIDKNSAGVYTYLPLGLRVLENIHGIIREELNRMGASELFMPALISKKYWEVTSRWNTDILYKVNDSSGQEYGLGFTHEEVLTPILKKVISSWRDLPVALYQIQTKFRDEPRARFGLVRGKEFIMKDLYSFHADDKDLDSYYLKVARVYKKIFKRLGLPVKVVEASGGDFTSEYTHEFQVLTPAGEDTIFYCSGCDFAQNKEIAKVHEGESCPLCKKGTIRKESGIEVGNIFKLGTRFSKPIDLSYKDKSGAKNFVVMGSYGLGSSRVMGALVELSHDSAGVLWTPAVSPFQVHLIELAGARAQASQIYGTLLKRDVNVLYDDRKGTSPGEKFADSDLFGIPLRIVVSAKTAAAKKVELKARGEKNVRLITIQKAIDYV